MHARLNWPARHTRIPYQSIIAASMICVGPWTSKQSVLESIAQYDSLGLIDQGQ